MILLFKLTYSRSCIGQRFAQLEIYIAVAKILQRFRLEYQGEHFEMVMDGLFNTPSKKIVMKYLDRK